MASAVLTLLLFGSIPTLGVITEDSIQPIIQRIVEAPNGSTVEIHFDSPGGSVAAGLVLIDTMETAQTLRRVRFLCTGGDLVASMAVTVFAQCDTRAAHLATRFLIHPVSTEIRGNAADFRKEAKKLDFISRLLFAIISERTGYPLESLWELAGARDWWFGRATALRMGLVNAC